MTIFQNLLFYQVIVTDLDKRYAYIQVTSVQPHFDCSELAQERLTVFEKNHDVRRFMYETPFTKDGRAHGNVDEQWKRQTILTSNCLLCSYTYMLLIELFNCGLVYYFS